MRLPAPRPRRAEAPNGLAAAARASGRFPALPENADRELPRPPREVAFLIREPERRSGALTVRISNKRSFFFGDRFELPSGVTVGLAEFVGFKLELAPSAAPVPPAEELILERARHGQDGAGG